MNNDTAVNTADTLSIKVLAAIKNMVAKQQVAKPIGVDSIALVVRMSLGDLIPVIEELQLQGELTIITNQVNAKNSKPNKVMLN